MSLQALIALLLASSRVVGADYVSTENNYVTNDPFRTTDSGRFSECPVDVWDRQRDLLPKKSQSGNQFKQTVSADWSLLWDITYHKSYKILKNELTKQCFVLNQCGVRPPDANDVPDGCKFVTVPISKAATDSTTYLPLLEVLGERRSLKVLATSFAYVSSPCFKKMYKKGMIEQADQYAYPVGDDVEKALKEAGVQVTFASNYGGTPHNGYLMTDINERGKDTAVLQAAEYVEAAGAFYNREKEATRAIERIVANYQCTKKAVEKALGTRERVKVLVSAYSTWSSAWSAGERGVYYDEMVRAAGGELIGTGPQYSTWTTEEIKDIAQDADVWISLGEWKKGEKPWSEMDDVPCVKAGRLFDNMRRGTNAWFEEKALQPDALLQDIALTTFPGAVAGLTHTWLRDIKAGDKIKKPEDDDCPDIDAPYRWLGVDSCGGPVPIAPVEGKCPKRGLEAVAKDDCPKELNLGNCDAEGLEAGDFCEGDGECGTDPDLDNCSNKDDKDMDIYRVKGRDSSSSSEESSSEESEEESSSEEPSEEPSEESSEEASEEEASEEEASEEEASEEESSSPEDAPEAKPGCPANELEPVKTCPRKPGLLLRCNQGANLVEGQMCRAKLGADECKTERDLGNCRGGDLNVYKVTGKKVPKVCPQERLGAKLVPVTSECSAQGPPEDLPSCYNEELFHDDYCKAEGECETRKTLGNCRGGKLNVYQVKVPKLCPKKLAKVETSDCPEKPGRLLRCHFGGLLAKGQMCRAKGECPKACAKGECDKEAPGNCRDGELSVFMVEKEAAQRVPAP